MKFSALHSLAAGALVTAALPAAPALAVTTLTFSGNICGVAGNAACSDSSQVGQNYGDIAGVLDISYQTVVAATNVVFEPYVKFWSSNFGDLSGVVWGGSGSLVHKSQITFSALPGYEVALLGFDAGCYLGRARCQTLNYSVDTPLGISGGSIGTNYPGHVNVPLMGGYSSSAVLSWGPDSFDTGLDNIQFDVRRISTDPGGVPEPATWLTMILGMGAVGFAMRRKPAATLRTA